MIGLTRRSLLAVGSAMALAPVAARAVELMGAQEHVPLWPGKIPGDIGTKITRRIDPRSGTDANPDRWIYGVARPELIVFRPANPNGAAVLCMPGGSYEFLAFDNEGAEQARWLNARGVTVFVLMYRLPAEGWARREDVPLQDAQRAMRVIRRDATKYGIDPRRVMALGFSAGGHLCGSLTTRHAEQTYAPVDAADHISARPDLSAMIYPVVTLDSPWAHTGSRDNLLGKDAPEALKRSHSVEQRVDADTPPLFVVHAEDDGTVPVQNSLDLYKAMLDHKRPIEMHLFDQGGHGFGVRLPADMPGSEWPRLLARFAARKGIIPQRAA